jgi:hypothetical protein
MPLLTPPDPAANSYVTNAEATTLLNDFVQTSVIVNFLAASTQDRERALITASQRLQYECFKGVKTEPDQSLAFPRKYLLRPGNQPPYIWDNFCCDNLTLADLEPYFYPDDIIPLAIKQVIVLLAADYLANTDLLINSSASGDSNYRVKKEKVDVLEVEYFESNLNQLNQGAFALPPISGLALNLLAPFLCKDPYEEIKNNTLTFRQVRRS